MADTTHKAYSQSATSVLTTALDGLASGTISSLSSAFDNSTLLDLFADFELVLGTQGSARSAGATVVLYVVTSLDGTNYPDVVSGVTPPAGVWALDAATTARRLVEPVIDVPIRPSATIKMAVQNLTGQAFAASGNTIKIRTHSVKTV